MIRVIGKVYPFKNKDWGVQYPWIIKKVIGFDGRGYAKTEVVGSAFMAEEDAVEYCKWWNRKYFKEQSDVAED